MSSFSTPSGNSVAKAIGLAILVMLLIVVGLFSHWVRTGSSPEIETQGPPNPEHPEPPFAPRDPNEPPVSKTEADRIAVNEVRKREGWVGKALPHAEREGFWWYILVSRVPEVPGDYRCVTVDGSDGTVREYNDIKTK